MAKRKKSNRKEHHVVPNKDGGWDVKINNAGHRTYHTRKKSTAIKKARAISRKHKTELVIHNSHGQIETSNSHDVVRRGKPGPKKHHKKTAKKHHKTKKSRRR
ncbi:MAG: DUF2188 domain-containing protein [Mycoplasmoidaceae bacterium]